MLTTSFYEYARTYAIQMVEADGTKDGATVVDSITGVSKNDLKLHTMPELFKRLLDSIRNANMKSKVIGNLADVENILFEFDHKMVLSKYDQKSDTLFTDLSDQLLKVREKRPRDTPRSIWPMFSKSILSGAHFLTQFDDVTDYYKWADTFVTPPSIPEALPLVIAEEVYGLGFALACDFIKETGYMKFGKPDVHLNNILKQLNLCDNHSSDYFVLKRMNHLATLNNVSPYEFDKILYLIGSGRFDTAADGKRITGKRAQFIMQAQIDHVKWEASCQ